MAATYKKLVLLILDGFGVATKSRGNAIFQAEPVNMNKLLSLYPALTLQASGPLVGLPWGERGNSEVGHLNMGAGRIVAQDLPRITSSIQSGDFFKNEAFIKACAYVREHKSKLHLLGMISPGGVHSYDEHAYALLGLAAEQKIENVLIHMITDGRDTPEKIAISSLQKLHDKIEESGVGKIATIAGRFYGMDRGGHWDQTELEYQAVVNGKGENASSALDCVVFNYSRGVYDEMIMPTVILENGKPVGTVGEGDAVIFFNFRQDRAVQLTQAFVQPEKMGIKNKHEKIKDLLFVTMTTYQKGLPVEVAYPDMEIDNDLAGVISAAGLKQFHVAEREKYAHVTSFFNGGKEDPLPGEERTIVSSQDNKMNYSDHPEMSSAKITDALLDKLKNSDTSFFVANFANPDMVGHTGNLEATIKAIKAVDQQIGRLAEATLAAEACLIITADHGNAEQMIDLKTGEIDKDHTTSPIPFIVAAREFAKALPDTTSYENLSSRMPEGALSDIAPTILDLMGLAKPPQMTGVSLLPNIEQK